MNRRKSRILTAVIVLAAMLLSACIALAETGNNVVTANALNVREKPDLDSPRIFGLKKGDIVEVLAEKKGWARIRVQGQYGYCMTEFLEKATSKNTEKPGGEYQVTANSLNIRADRSGGSARIGGYSRGEIVTVLGICNGWGRVVYNGQTGYVDMQYLREYTGSVYSVHFVYDDGTVQYDDTLTTDTAGRVGFVPSVEPAEGIRFLGWCTAQDGSGTWHGPESVYLEDTVLYGCWETESAQPKQAGKYRVLFVDRNPDNLVHMDEFYTNEDGRLTDEPHNEAPDGWRLRGWAFEENADTWDLHIHSVKNHVFTSDTDLYAVYRRTSTYILPAGTKIYSTAIKSDDRVKEVLEKDEEARCLEIVYGANAADTWYLVRFEDGRTGYVPADSTQRTDPYRTFRLDPAGGTVLVKGITVTDDFPPEQLEKELPTPIRDHCTFLGWSVEHTGLTVTQVGAFGPDVTLYAMWKAEQYNVTFDPAYSGGKVKTVRTKSGGSPEEDFTIGQMPVPERKGYIFEGWYTKKSGGTEWSGSMKCSGDMTLYAHWTPVGVFTVTFDLDGKSANGIDTFTMQTDECGCIEKLPTPKGKDGLNFEGWFDANDDRVKSPAYFTKDARLTACWSANPSISY